MLIQGRASLSPIDDRSWLERHREAWERFAGPRDVGGLWESWLRYYHWRIGIDLAVERIIVWPNLDCLGPSAVYGAPLPDWSPASQQVPRHGVGPRVDHARAARRIARRPNRLLGWVGADGFPVIVPITTSTVEEAGIVLEAHVDLPQGARRAGLVSHSFSRYSYGQHQHKFTGWLHVQGHHAVYAPHTAAGYYLASSRTVYRVGAGLATRRGYREARRAGFIANTHDRGMA